MNVDDILAEMSSDDDDNEDGKDDKDVDIDSSEDDDKSSDKSDSKEESKSDGKSKEHEESQSSKGFEIMSKSEVSEKGLEVVKTESKDAVKEKAEEEVEVATPGPEQLPEKEQEAKEEGDKDDQKADEDPRKEDIIEDTPIGEAEPGDKLDSNASPAKEDKEDALLSKEGELDLSNTRRQTRDDSRLGARGSIRLEAGDHDELGFDNRDIIQQNKQTMGAPP